MPDLEGRLKEVRSRLASAAARSGRSPSGITLLAVTKTVPLDILREAFDLGLRDFGENRVQEAMGKISSLPTGIRWHLIGRLQTNKINKVLGKFVLIHSVDSLHLAQDLALRGKGNVQEILLEVNTSGEASKAGVPPHEAESEAGRICGLPGLKLRGLMTVGPLTDDPQRRRDAFKKLKELFESIRNRSRAGGDFSVLSMGMSGDFEAAVEEGSTLVRIGTALFGERV